MQFVHEGHPLNLLDVQNYCFRKHHILPGHQCANIVEAAESLFGVHSARLPTAFVSLQPRVSNFRPSDLRNSLYVDKELIKLRCMRKTLHVLPLDLAPVVHQATKSLRLSDCLRFYRQNGVSEARVKELCQAVAEFVGIRPTASSDIVKAMIDHEKIPAKWPEPLKTKLIRVVIKNLWEEGVLCYINDNSHWASETRLYGLTDDFYPEAKLNKLQTERAQETLFLRYIERFGPVTVSDAAWWSGLGKGVVFNCISQLDEQLIQTRVEGFDDVFYMTRSDFDSFQSFTPFREDWTALLAYEDPSLKGYFGSRLRYVDTHDYDKLFNQIGEARASVVLNGRVVGVWTWDKKQHTVDLALFKRLSHRQMKLLEKSVIDMRDCMRLDNPMTPYRA